MLIVHSTVEMQYVGVVPARTVVEVKVVVPCIIGIQCSCIVVLVPCSVDLQYV